MHMLGTPVPPTDGPSETGITVNDVHYTSNTSLRAAWVARVRRYTGKRTRTIPRRRALKPVDAAWFLEVARKCPSHAARVGFADSADHTLFIDRADLAFGTGACNSTVGRLPGGLNKHLRYHACVFVQQGDGRPRALSNKLDIRSTPPSRTDARLVVAWMRQSVQGQIDEFRVKTRTGASRCHLCDKNLQARPNHVDHGTGVHSFHSLTEAFWQHTGTPMQARVLLTSADLVRMRSRWQRYHRKHAVLKMACVACNLANR